MGNYISDESWARFNSIISETLENDFTNTEITWYKYIDVPKVFAESSNKYHEVKLVALKSYNYMRTWPINTQTPSGSRDNEHLVLWVSKRLLTERGLIVDGALDIDIARDVFLIEGHYYRCGGDTPVSHAHNEDLAYNIICTRDNDIKSIETI